MKKTVLAGFAVLFALLGCTRTWMYQPLESYRPAGPVPPAELCRSCHESQFESWKKTRHAGDAAMAKIPVPEFHECGACHADAAAHAADPQNARPLSVARMTKSEQNTLCGKCHYNQQFFGKRAINPHDKHALFASVGLEGKKKQIACLDCHSGHRGKSEMLVSIKAHICFKCHTSAIFTMGIFQPINYLTFGKACQACHSVHGGSDAARWTRMGVGFCVVCHFAGVALVD